MIWPFFILLIAVLAVPSDRQHRLALGLVAFGLIVVAALVVALDKQAFYIAQCVVWLTIAKIISSIATRKHWLNLSIGAILLVVAGVAVIPAAMAGDDIVPFTSISLVISDVTGVVSIFVLGLPGLITAVTWLWGLGASFGSFRNSPSVDRSTDT